MLATDLLSSIIPTVAPTESASTALELMDVFKVSHLPVVDGDEYIGLISDTIIYDLDNADRKICECHLHLPTPAVRGSQHIFEVIDMLSKTMLTTLPVVNDNGQYLGVIGISDLAFELSHLLSSENPGAIIELEMNVYDYSLSQIAQIVESNDSKVLSLHVRNTSPDTIVVTIKLNRTDVSGVIQTFERYNYNITAVHSVNEQYSSMLQDRLNSFIKFLNI